MIKITSDSTADLGVLFAENGIDTMPLTVILGDDSFEDGVNIAPEQIFDFVTKKNILPKTAARSVEEFKDFFSSRIADGSELIHFCISSCISVTYENARKAASMLDGVYVVDSQSLSSGTGLLVLYALDLRNSGKYSAQEIYDKCMARVPAVEASFIVDTMEYLYKGGRCSGLTSFVASVLNIKPSLLLKNGKIVVGKKFMGKVEKVADKYVDNILALYKNPDTTRVFITHSHAERKVVDLVRKTVEEKTGFKQIIETVASATITSHCGKGTIGILYINDGDHPID